MGALISLDRRVRDRRAVPAFRLAESGMEVQARATEIRVGLDSIARRAWTSRDPWTLRQVATLTRSLAALDTEGKRIAGWGDEADCADGIDGPGHVVAVGQ